MDKDAIQRAYENWLTISLYWAMRVAVGVGFLVHAYLADWGTAFFTLVVLFLMLLPNILKRRFGFYLPFALDFGIVALTFLGLFIGGVQQYYLYLPGWDKFVHLQSGLTLAVAGFVVVYLLNETERARLDLSPFFVALFAVMFAVLFGVLWEIVEFTVDSLFVGAHWQLGNADTMWDLIADTVGALIVSTIGYIWMRYESRIPFTPRFLGKNSVYSKK